MPPRHTPALSHILAPHRTQTGRMVKSKANATIHQVTTPSHEPGPTPNPADLILIQDPNISAPCLDITLLNALTTWFKGYKSGLDALKTTIQGNQIETVLQTNDRLLVEELLMQKEVHVCISLAPGFLNLII